MAQQAQAERAEQAWPRPVEEPDDVAGPEGRPEEEDDDIYLDVTMFEEDEGIVDLETAMLAPEEEEEDPFYFVRARATGPRSDVYQAARVGDVARIRFLVEEEGVDVNQRDRWDSVPLYYACLAGHVEVAQYLLEAGAVCNEYTFDGDRCHYAALTGAIRALLRAYEQRPPPLAPLAVNLRSLLPLCDDLEAPGAAARREEAPWCDFAFEVAGERIPLHRAILAARSPFFRRMLLSDWRSTGAEARGYRVVSLVNAALSAPALKAVLAFAYTERVDIGMADVDAFLRVARRCRLQALVGAGGEELRTLKYYFKSTRRDDTAPRRFVLQPGALPEAARLPAQLGALLALAAELEASGCAAPGRDFADVRLRVGGATFRAHCCILAARSDYFAALLARADALQQPQPAAAGARRQQRPQQPRASGDGSGSGAAEQEPAAQSHQPSEHEPGWQASSSAGAKEEQQQWKQADADGSDLGRQQQQHTKPSSGSKEQQEEQPGSRGGAAAELPVVAVADVSPGVFQAMLRFVYTDGVPDLAPGLLSDEGTEALFDAADRYLLFSMKRKVAEAIIAAWDRRPPKLEPLCRMLLVADRFGVTLLRDAALHALAARFEALAEERAPLQEREVFEAFVAAVAPKDAEDIFDGSAVMGASHGRIEGSGATGLGIGTILQDLREAFLEDYGGAGEERDRSGDWFDARLQELATCAFEREGIEAADDDGDA